MTLFGFGDPLATENTTFVEDQLRDVMAKLLERTSCKNITVGEIPPITTPAELANRLQDWPDNIDQPRHEMWTHMIERVRDESPQGIHNTSYFQSYDITLIGVVGDATFKEGYEYIQDKGEEILYTIEKNKSLGGAGTVSRDASAVFDFTRHIEMFMHQCIIKLKLLVRVEESSGRVFN